MNKNEIVQKLNEKGFLAKILELSTSGNNNSTELKIELEEYRDAVFKVTGMTCGSCVGIIESFLGNTDGIVNCSVNLMTTKAKVKYNPSTISIEGIIEAIETVGFQAELETVEEPEKKEQKNNKNQDHSKIVLNIKGMTCGSCVEIISNYLKNQEGIIDATVNLITTKAFVQYNNKLIGIRQIISAISDVGFEASVPSEESLQKDAEALKRTVEIQMYKDLLKRVLIFAIPLFLWTMVLDKFPETKYVQDIKVAGGVTLSALVSFILTTPVHFYYGSKFHIAAYKSLSHGSATMDVLVSLGTNAAYFYSLLSMMVAFFNPQFKELIFFETSVFLITSILLGRYAENVAKGKTSEAITKLLNLKPSFCNIVQLDDKGNIKSEEKIPSSVIEKGDVIRIMPGETFSADGVIVKGETSVNESMITGESRPIDKKVFFFSIFLIFSQLYFYFYLFIFKYLFFFIGWRFCNWWHNQ